MLVIISAVVAFLFFIIFFCFQISVINQLMKVSSINSNSDKNSEKKYFISATA